MTFAAAPAHAASACPAVDQAWLQFVAGGTPVFYGFTAEGTIQSKGKDTPFTSVGVIRFQGESVTSLDGGSLIRGAAFGHETQNVGGVVTTVPFGTFEFAPSTFTFDTRDCTGTVSRLFPNLSMVVWQVVLVDGENTIRFIDTRANPFVRPGVLRLMR